MKNIVDLFQNKVLCIFTLILSIQGLHASQDKPTFQYSAKHTEQLKVLYLQNLNALNYWQRHRDILEMVRDQQADPNCFTGSGFSSRPLLCVAVFQNDRELVDCCLQHGAYATYKHPIKHAQSVEVLKSLIAHKASLDYEQNNHNTLLHYAADHGRSPAVMAFLCAAGLDTNKSPVTWKGVGDCPLHRLFLHAHNLSLDEKMHNAAILAWYGADPYKKNRIGQAPLNVLSEEPKKKFLAILNVLPGVKEEYSQQSRIEHKQAGTADSSVQPAWSEDAWVKINTLIAQQDSSKPGSPFSAVA